MDEEKKAVDEDSEDNLTPSDEGDQEIEEKPVALEGRKILQSCLLQTDDDDFSAHEVGLIAASIAQYEANMNFCFLSPDPKFQRFRFNTPSSTPPCTPLATPSSPATLAVPPSVTTPHISPQISPQASPQVSPQLSPQVSPHTSPRFDPLPPPKPSPPPIHPQPLFTLFRYFLPSDFILLSVTVGIVSVLSLQAGVAFFSLFFILALLLQLHQDVIDNSPQNCSLLYEHFHKLICKMSYPIYWLSIHRFSITHSPVPEEVEEVWGPFEVPEAPPLELNPIIKITPPAEEAPPEAAAPVAEEPFVPDPGVPEAPEGPPGGPPGAPGAPGGPGLPGFGVEDPVTKYGLPPIKVCPFQLKMKALHWVVIAPGKVKGTIWEELAIQQAELGEVPNYDNFEKCFQEKKVELKLKLKEPDKRTRFLDHKRSNMIEIALSSFPASVPALLEAILSMNEEIIVPDRLTRLVEMLPTEKERGPLKAHANTPKEQLGDAEAFLVQLATIPHLDVRLSTHLAITQFRERCVFLETSLDSVALALDELRLSENLRKVFADVLNFGNHMNSSNSKGPDYGFGLEFLDKLVITKSMDRSMNLLHYIIDHLRSVSGQKMITSAAGQKPQSFLADLPHLAAAARVECSSMLGELKTMKKEFDMIRRALKLIAPTEADALIIDPLPAEWKELDKFGEKVRRFYCDGLVFYYRLTSRFRSCCAAAQDLAMYFGSFHADQLVQRQSDLADSAPPRKLKERDDLDMDLYSWNGTLSLFKNFHDAFCKAESELDEIHRARARKEKQPPKIKKTLQPPSEAAATLASLLRATTPRAA